MGKATIDAKSGGVIYPIKTFLFLFVLLFSFTFISAAEPTFKIIEDGVKKTTVQTGEESIVNYQGWRGLDSEPYIYGGVFDYQNKTYLCGIDSRAKSTAFFNNEKIKVSTSNILDLNKGSVDFNNLNISKDDPSLQLTDYLSPMFISKAITKYPYDSFGYCYIVNESTDLKKVKLFNNSVYYEQISEVRRESKNGAFNEMGFQVEALNKYGWVLDNGITWSKIDSEDKKTLDFSFSVDNYTLPLTRFGYRVWNNGNLSWDKDRSVVVQGDKEMNFNKLFYKYENRIDGATVEIVNNNAFDCASYLGALDISGFWSCVQETKYIDFMFEGEIFNPDPTIVTTTTTSSGSSQNQTVIEGDSYAHLEINDTSERYLQVNGINQYIKTAASASLTLDSSFSISAWSKNSNAYFIYMDNGNSIVALRPAGMYARDSTATNIMNAGGTNPNNQTWNHVVGVKNGTTITVYVNGVLNATATNASFGSLNTNDFWYIGVSQITGADTISSTFNGSIDEVQIFNRALTVEEIANIYALNRTNYNGSTSGMVAYWNFDNNPNNGLDSSGFGNTGTFTNGAYTSIYDNSYTQFDRSGWNEPYNSLVAYYPFDSDFDNRIQQGKIDNALFYDGANDCSLFSAVETTNTSTTISYWAYFNTINTAGQFHSSVTANAFIHVVSTDLNVRGGNNVNMNFDTNFVAGNWYQIIITSDTSARRRVYINGTEVANTTSATNFASTVFDRAGVCLSTSITGRMDEIKIYNRTFDATEAMNLYTNESAGIRYSSINSTGLLRELRMENLSNYDDANQSYGVLSLTGTTYDITNNNLDGTTTIGTVYAPHLNRSAAGIVNQIYGDYLSFAGSTGGQIDIPDNSIFSFGNTSSGGNDRPFTLSIWANTRKNATAQGIMGKGLVTASWEYDTYYRSTNQIAFDLFTAGDNNKYIGRQTEVRNDLLNQWHLLTFVYNGNKTADGIDIYIDGVVADTQNFNGSASYTGMIDGTATPRIGWSGNNYFNGTLDEAMWFATNLSAQQVMELYNNQSKRFKDNGTVTLKQITLPESASGMYFNKSLYGQNQENLNSNIQVRAGYWNTQNGYNTSDAGLYGYWSMDGVDKDLNNVTGKVGDALRFDGMNDYVQIADANTLKLTNQLSLSGWINLNKYPTANAYIIDKQNRYSLLVNASGIVQLILNYPTGGYARVVSTTPLNNNTWYYLVGTYNGTGAYLWIDGVMVNSLAYSQTIITDTNPVRIGMYSNAGGATSTDWGFNGSIDQVRIWNRSLSATEIANIYSNESNGNVDPNMNRTSLVGEWTFNYTALSGSTITAPDTSGNNNDGTLNNMLNVKDLLGHNGATINTGYVNGTGLFNYSYTSAGANSNYVEINNVTNFNSTSYSFGGWVLYNQSRNFNAIFFKGNSTSNNNDIELYSSTSNRLQYVLNRGNASTLSAYLSAYGMTIGTWTHVMTVVDGSSGGSVIRIYINGNYQEQSSVLNLTQNRYNNLYIGGTAGAASITLNGSIDDFALWNRTLSATEIKDLYIKGRANWQYTNWQNLNSTGDTVFEFQQNSTNVLPEYKLIANTTQLNQSFYTPQLNLNNQTYTFDYISLTQQGIVETWINGARANYQMDLVGETVLIQGNLTKGNFGSLNMTINGVQVNSSTIGNITYVYDPTTLGVKVVNVSYSGTEDFTPNWESWNITVVHTGVPSVDIVYPVSAASYNQTTLDLNYTVDEPAPEFCWYSKDGGLTNSSRVISGVNFTGVTGVVGQNTWTVYCNDTAGNIGFNSVTFTINQLVPPLSIDFDPNSPVAQGVPVDIYGLGCPSELTCTLHRDGNVVANPVIDTLMIEGVYEYEFNTTGNANYTAYSVKANLTITNGGGGGNATGNFNCVVHRPLFDDLTFKGIVRPVYCPCDARSPLFTGSCT